MRYLLILIFLGGFQIQVFTQEIPVTIPNSPYDLNGILSIPSTPGPHPVVILIHGSGPSDKDQLSVLSGGNSACLYPGLLNDTIYTFKDLSVCFAQKGVAVLRYDKRTLTYSAQLNQKTITPYDFIDDVHAAVDFVKSRSEIDTNKIILLGHSQGANFLPIIAKERNDIIGIIGLGTAARGIDSILAIQLRDLNYICLQDTVAGDNVYNQTLSDFQQIRIGTWNPNTPYFGAYPKFWLDWIHITDSSLYNFNSISHSTLLLHAMQDFNIPLEDAQRYENQITRSEFALYYMDGLTHFFTTATNPRVDKNVCDTIFKWLDEKQIVGISKESEFGNDLKVSVYPNPTSGQLVIKSFMTISEIEIYDILGKKIQDIKNVNKENVIFELTARRGIYIVQVKSENGLIKSFKVIKE